MFNLDPFVLYYDIIAYIVAFYSLIDDVLYKLGMKRRLDVDEELPSDLTGRVAIVTGGTRGIGLSVVRALISKGCFVFVASSQTRDRFEQITSEIYRSIPDRNSISGVRKGTVSIHNLDLSSMDSVKAFVLAFKDTKLNLNYIICNAGIMFAPRQITEDNFESHLAINYLGHTLLIMELLSIIKSTADKSKINCRIINVASSTHKITRFRFEDLLGEVNYSSSQAYAQSKLAQIMFTAKLSRVMRQEYRWNNVQCFSLHPGVVLSELYEHVKLIKMFPFLIPIIKIFTRDIVQGAETTLYATLSSELNCSCGEYLESCAIKKPSKRARNEEDQDRLWEVTNRLLTEWIDSEWDMNRKSI